jgi:hypothetical protein
MTLKLDIEKLRHLIEIERKSFRKVAILVKCHRSTISYYCKKNNIHKVTVDKFVDTKGYVMFAYPNHPRTNAKGYVREHILVMEAAIGRYVVWPEQIHHINGIKSDNRIENLQLCANHAEHFKLHRTKWDIERIKQLRNEGKSYKNIGEQIGCGPTHVRRLLNGKSRG